MKQEALLLIAMLAIALLATIPQIPVDAQIWGALLAIIGIVTAVLVNYHKDVNQRIVIYVLAIALPMFNDVLHNIWVVGAWASTFLDNVAIGVQGAAVGVFVMAIIGRITGD